MSTFYTLKQGSCWNKTIKTNKTVLEWSRLIAYGYWSWVRLCLPADSADQELDRKINDWSTADFLCLQHKSCVAQVHTLASSVRLKWNSSQS